MVQAPMTVLTTRLATVEDYAHFTRLFPELRVPDPLPTASDFATLMLPRVLLLCDGDAVIGYSHWQIYGQAAHVVHVVVDPTARNRGAGRALMEATRAAARAAGCTRWMLNVKLDNEPARRLYQRCGLGEAYHSWALRLDWAVVDALPRPGGSAALGAIDEAAIAARFDLLPERFELWRRRGATFVALWEDGAPVAFATYDARFAGAYPFRVARPELLRALLEAIRPHAVGDQLRLSIEGDAPAKDALLGAGAALVFALAHMTGPLAPGAAD